MLPVPEDHRSVLRSASWFGQTHLLRRRKLCASVDALGLEVRAFSRDLVGRHLFKRGVYEQDLTAFVLQRLSMPADAVVLDIGALVTLTGQAPCPEALLVGDQRLDLLSLHS
jgi:cell division FtsZ-interacting protein ZapD